MSLQCCNYSKQCRNNAATLCCATNCCCESSRVTSPYGRVIAAKNHDADTKVFTFFARGVGHVMQHTITAILMLSTKNILRQTLVKFGRKTLKFNTCALLSFPIYSISVSLLLTAGGCSLNWILFPHFSAKKPNQQIIIKLRT